MINMNMKDKGWYEFRYFNKKRLLIQIGLISAIVTASFFSSFIILSAVSKDANIHLYTDLDINEYDRISLIARRKGETYYLPLNLERKSSYFTITKTSKLYAFEVEKDIVISDDLNEEILHSYNHSETIQGNQSEYNVEYREGLLNNQYNELNFSVKTEHYDGVYSFFYDENEEEPNNFSIDYGSAIVKDEYENHKKVLFLEDYTKINQNFNEISNGTIEFWVIPRPKQDFELRIYDNSVAIFKIKTTCTTNRLYYYHFINGWVDTGKLADNKISPSDWTNIRIDFRCNTAPDYLGLTEGTYDVYIDNELIYAGLNFLFYSEGINKINYKSLGYKNEVIFDSISYTWLNKELDNTPYKIGDKDITINAIAKTYYYDFEFEDVNYKHLKNATVFLDFEINETITPFGKTGLKVYDFLSEEWVYLKEFSSNKSLIMDITHLQYFNNSNTNTTNIHFALTMSNFINDYDVIINISCEANFWKEISEFFYTETVDFSAELSININVTTHYNEKEIIVTSLIEVYEYYCFGSWTYINYILLNHTVTIREQLYLFDIENPPNLATDSFFGWRILNIKITEIDLEGKVFNTKMSFGDFYV